MNVKAQGLLNGARWIEQTYGQGALATVLQACTTAVRDRYISATALTWHPLDELLELVGVADRLLGAGDGAIAEEVGAAGARANTKTLMMRVVVHIANPEFLMRRAAGMWSQFNDEGTMEIVAFESRRLVVQLTGCRELPLLFVRILSGWGREIANAVAAHDAVARVVEHVERGRARAAWELTWTRSLGEGARDRGELPATRSP